LKLRSRIHTSHYAWQLQKTTEVARVPELQKEPLAYRGGRP
jgi:hypothetical protein